jgi:tRNA isopentenyl-2-thiomethyl-A-37 hydroxylase MiaE
VRKHRDDELRHARLFRDCLARQATAPVPRPPSVIQFIDRELGGFMSSFVDNRQTVMEAYVLLQVIEERGVEQYPRFARALAPHDGETARVIEDVVRDEERHVKYAKAISKRYAPDEATLAAALQRFRAAEDRAFREQGNEFLAQAIDADLLAVGRIERAGWRALSSLAGRRFVAGVTVRNQPLVVERAEHASRAS